MIRKITIAILLFNITTPSFASNINDNIVEIQGTPFNKTEMSYIYKKTKDFIKQNEGVVYKAYNLCKKDKEGKIKKVFDKIANRFIDDCEYQHINGAKQYIKKTIKRRFRKSIITYEPVKLYTICYGNTHIVDNNGKFVRFIKPNETMTKAQCNNMFASQFNKYQKLLYRNMTDKYQVNWFNKMNVDEVVAMMDIIWHNGYNGSKKTSWAMINYVKYRTQAGRVRLYKSIQKDLKQNKHYNNFKNRRMKYNKLIFGEEK